MTLILIAIGLALFNAACLALIFLGLPGTWLLLTSCALTDHWTQADLFAPATLWGAAAFAALGEILEWTTSARGARRSGASRKGTLAALFGGIGGGVIGTFMIPLPLVGTMVGAGLGAFLACAAVEMKGGQLAPEAMRAGRGAAKGQLVGTMLKLSIGVSLWVLLTIASFW